MAALPKYEFKGEVYPDPPTPASAPPPHCNCHNQVVSHQQCPRCINNPSTTVHWYAPPPGTPSQTGIGFNPPAYPSTNPAYPSTNPVYTSTNPAYPSTNPAYPSTNPVYTSTNPAYPSTNPVYPSTNPAWPPTYTPTSPCPTCHSYSCSGHVYQPTPVVVPKPSTGGVKPYYWVDSSTRGGIPSTAIQGGHDCDGAKIFVGRAFHDGDWLPAKVIPQRKVAYVAYNGGEHAKHQYQVLCEQTFNWVHSSGGHIPPGAVEGGKTKTGETLYVGRVHHAGSITVGKVHPSHGVCYIPFGGKEIGQRNYEVLVLRS